MVKPDLFLPEVFRNSFHVVYRIALFYTQDPYLAEDAVQETFIKAYKQIHTLKDHTKARAWLSVIAKRSSIDLIRREQSSRWISIEEINDENIRSTTPTLEEEVEMHWIYQQTLSGIEKLKPEFQQIIRLKMIMELKDEEIARILNLRLGTVRSRLYHAKCKLRVILGNLIVSFSWICFWSENAL